jgi:lipopolysaccharide transport system ATP-binding protein
MKKVEINRKVDEIIDFAELETFIDTPVKRYSSGMYVRLAFSVAAHLEPDILLVDEVLAVGDIQFQEKCLGKMDDASRNGRTILFVSHNMSSMKRLCRTGLLLNDGCLEYHGDIDEAIHIYMQGGHNVERSLPIGNEFFLLTNFEIAPKRPVATHEPVDVKIEFRIDRIAKGLRVGFDLLDASGGILFRTYHDDMAARPVALDQGDHVLCARIPPNLLKAGRYFVSVQVGIHNACMILNGNIQLPIDLVLTDGVNAVYGGHPIGHVMPAVEWSATKSPAVLCS